LQGASLLTFVPAETVTPGVAYPARTCAGWHALETTSQFTASIVCRKCGQEGSIVWEQSADKSKRSIFSISDGFYRRVRGNHSAMPAVICDSCGTALKSHALSVSESPANGNNG
jgi:hypothetical protein